MQSVFSQLAYRRLVPVVAIDDASTARPLVDALIAGGLPVIEITFRTAAAAEAIKSVSGVSGMLVGAGTVLNKETASRAIDAGAKFVVSPGVNREVIEYCQKREIEVIPGVVTPTEIMAALSMGVEVLKFFPAEAYGGLKTLKAISPVFPHVKFMPTGGITQENVVAYLDFKPVVACGGSWMVTRENLAQGRYDQIARVTRESVDLVAGQK